MDIQKELEKVEAENHKTARTHQRLLQQVLQIEQKIQQNNGVIMFLLDQLEQIAKENPKSK